jgi:hypothetical protein
MVSIDVRCLDGLEPGTLKVTPYDGKRKEPGQSGDAPL